jgi:hypothetical protein
MKAQAKQNTTSPSGDHSATSASNSAISPAASLQANHAGQPASNTAKKQPGPGPWPDFAVQCLLCVFTLGAFMESIVLE